MGKWRVAVSWYLRVQILAFDTQVGIDDVEAHQQAHDHRSLLLQHQRRILIEITVKNTNIVLLLKPNSSKQADRFCVCVPEQVFPGDEESQIVGQALLHQSQT